ncbi:MAG: hypothetical protein V1720_01360 [bacterium]
MLERILNINAQKDYRGTKRASSYERFISRPFIDSIFGKDSAIISPAAIFFSRLNWHLKEAHFDNNEKISFDFFINEFEFKTDFDFVNFFSTEMHQFNIIQETVRNDKSIKSLIKLGLKKDRVFVIDNMPRIEFVALRELYKRMLKLSLETELNILDSFALNGLKDGIENELFDELTPILIGLYTLVYKLNKFDLKSSYSFNKYSENLIQIEKVSKVYA